MFFGASRLSTVRALHLLTDATRSRLHVHFEVWVRSTRKRGFERESRSSFLFFLTLAFELDDCHHLAGGTKRRKESTGRQENSVGFQGRQL